MSGPRHAGAAADEEDGLLAPEGLDAGLDNENENVQQAAARPRGTSNMSTGSNVLLGETPQSLALMRRAQRENSLNRGCLKVTAWVCFALGVTRLMRTLAVMRLRPLPQTGAADITQIKLGPEDVFPADVEDWAVDYEGLFGALEMDNRLRYNLSESKWGESRLHRTLTRPYNDLRDDGEQYFLYSPSGGFNNQLRCLESGALLAKHSNRTLVVPMAARHSSLFTGYMRLGINDMVPMDHLLDLGFFERHYGISIVALNVTLGKFAKEWLKGPRWAAGNGTVWTYRIHTPLIEAEKRDFLSLQNQIKRTKMQVAWVYGRFYNHHWISKETKQSIRYSRYLVDMARLVVDEVVGRPFNSMHIRLGDYRVGAKGEARDASHFVGRAYELGFRKQDTVYVATDGHPRDAKGTLTAYFRPFKRYQKVIFYHDLANHPRVGLALVDLERRLPDNKKLLNDMFGIVEQLVCAQARLFVGTAISTFSKQILTARTNFLTNFPEVDEETLTGRMSRMISWDGHVTWTGVTELHPRPPSLKDEFQGAADSTPEHNDDEHNDDDENNDDDINDVDINDDDDDDDDGGDDAPP